MLSARLVREQGWRSRHTFLRRQNSCSTQPACLGRQTASPTSEPSLSLASPHEVGEHVPLCTGTDLRPAREPQRGPIVPAFLALGCWLVSRSGFDQKVRPDLKNRPRASSVQTHLLPPN
ncbi:hypothetical protein DR999_PMT18952 [Platysternon megacephalum]|uniref:Uncharacterized protein n=1 Tax=Platysternon megacephalum TaxID=55544 RepID=A0A4D9DNB8_9SAUR|nr:hypothetical protein DR999_PMT18952 [Platysternon megacephalum]